MIPSIVAAIAKNFNSLDEMDYAIHISEEFRFIYFSNPKCGCTTVKATLNLACAKTGGLQLHYSSLADIHDRSRNLLKRPMDVGYERFVELLGDESISKFSVIREPISRLASAFENKLTGDSDARQAFNLRRGWPSDASVDFLEFIRAIAGSTELRDCDEHWRLQRKQICFEQVPMMELFRFKQLNVFLDTFIKEKFSRNDVEVFDAREHFQENKSTSMSRVAETSEHDASVIREVYAADFDLCERTSERRLEVASVAVEHQSSCMMNSVFARFESLGDNCEFGFAQRRGQYESGGLLRWAISSPESLLKALADDFKALYQYENLLPAADDMVVDNSYGLSFHSQMRSTVTPEGRKFVHTESQRAEIYADEIQKIDYLRSRLLNDLAAGEKIFVYKINLKTPMDVARRILGELRRFNSTNTLLIVGAYEREPGSVWQEEPGLLVGSITRLAPYEKADDIEYAQWRKICECVVTAPTKKLAQGL